MGNKTWGLVLEAPALLLLIASFLAGIYAAAYNIQDMGYEVPIILGVVIVLYFIGSKIERNYYKQLVSNSDSKPVMRKKEKEEELIIPDEGF